MRAGEGRSRQAWRTGRLPFITSATARSLLDPHAEPCHVDLNECDVYHFSPQKALASDGGLWIAALSPATIERIEARAAAGDRWIPPFVNLKDALDNSRKDRP